MQDTTPSAVEISQTLTPEVKDTHTEISTQKDQHHIHAATLNEVVDTKLKEENKEASNKHLDYEKEIARLQEEVNSLKIEQAKVKRDAQIAALCQKHNLSAHDFQYTTIPLEGDLDKFFTEYKQYLINKGLSAPAPISTAKQEEMLATSYLDEIAVKEKR